MDGHQGYRHTIPKELADRFRKLRQYMPALTTHLSAEDCQIQSMPDASPLKWHLAHTSWFWETFILIPYFPNYSVFSDQYSYLFNSYYEAVGDRQPRAQRGMLTRPSLDEVLEYRAHIDQGMLSLLKGLSTDLSVSTITDLIHLGIAHEEQHCELALSDIKHALFQNPLMPAALPAPSGLKPDQMTEPSDISWSTFEAGLYQIGMEKDAGFGFDNEFPRHKVWVDSFALANRLVSNREIIHFIEDKGYQTSSLWLSDGWADIKSQSHKAPLYWFEKDGQWMQYTLYGPMRVDPNAPAVHLNYYEAAAIAEWMGARLPTEAEWEIAASTRPAHLDASGMSGLYHPAFCSSDALADLYGQVWQWTQSAYTPYPGFATPKGAIGEYNGKFMCGQYVLRGSSCATSPGHSRSTYRNFFYPKDRWQFTGLRLAKAI